MLICGRTDGASSDATPAISASRGSRRGLSPPSTTTVISMGSSCAKPAARGPVRTTRAGLVPPAVELAMRASWGEVKWLDVRPVVVPWLPDVGTVVVYLFRERVTDAAQPLGDLVVVVQDDEADPPALTEVTDEPDVQPLTPRELEVLRLMALGWETEYIAAELEVTLHTVRSHVANLRRKLNAKSRFEAVMTATRLGILSLGDR